MFCSRFVLRSLLSLGAVLVSASVCPAALASQGSGSAARPAVAQRTAAQASSKALPLVFEQNAGQLPEGTAFAGRTQGYTVEVRPTELRFALPGKKTTRTIEMQFTGAQPGVAAGVSEAGFRTNFYLGSDRSKWITGVRNYDRVALRGVYDGIDAEFYSHSNEIEHDFIVKPGADASQLSMHLTGAQSVKLSESGDVSLNAEEGFLRLHKPVAYQMMADGSRRGVDVRFSLTQDAAGADVGFALGEYDHTRTLVIDPDITYATYVTGAAGSVPAAVAADAAGNVYLTGYTSSAITSFGAAATTSNPTGTMATPYAPTSTNYATFVAKLAATASGSQVAWVSYYGSTTGYVQATSMALVPAGTNLFVGGFTTALDLPGTGTTATTYDHSPVSVAGSILGFAASFAQATGVFAATAYIEGTTAAGGTTKVAAITADASYVHVAGYTTGNGLTPTSTALPVPPMVIANTSLQKGIIVRLDPTLTTATYVSYVAGDTATTTSGTMLTAITTDAAENIYFTGSTYGDFPKGGAYSASNMNTPVMGKLGQNAFAAEILSAPNPPASVGPPAVAAGPPTPTTTLAFSFWSGGPANDIASGLTRDASGNVFVFGQTQSMTLTTTAVSTQSVPTMPAAAPAALDTVYPTGVTVAGFAAKLDVNGALLTTTLLTSNVANSTSVALSGVTDATGNVYIVGNSNSSKASFPQATSGMTTASITGTPLLAAGEDLSADSATTTTGSHSFLLEMPSTLNSVTYKAFFGPSAGSSSAAGVAIDAATAPKAYVLLNDTATTTGAGSFTTASAAEQAPQIAATSSAYVAQVAFGAPASSASILAGAVSNTPTTGVTFTSPTTFSTVNFTWNIVGAANGATSVVFNLPYNADLQPYSTTALPVITGATGTCTLGPTSALTPPTNTNPGITCIIPTLASGATATITFSDGITALAVAGLATGFTVNATAYDAQGDTLPLNQTVAINRAPLLSLSYSVSPNAVNAAATGAPAPTTVTYTFVITNSSINDSPNTTLSNGIASLSKTLSNITTTSTASGGCVPTATVVCDVPANSSITVTVTGNYLATTFGSTTSGPYVSDFTTTPSVSSTTGGTTTTVAGSASGTTAVTITGNSAIAVTLSTGTATYSGGFKLGDTGVQLLATATNTGTNQAAGVSVPVTLPKGFTASGATITSGSGTASCTSTTCTANFKDIPGVNGTAVVTITGTFNDTGMTSDAVAPPATSATPTQATVAASLTSGTVTETVAASSVTVTGSYAPANTAASANITVTRVNVLAFGVTVATPITGNKVNELSPNHAALGATTAQDTVTYTTTVSNTGTSVARGAYFTIPLPTSTTGTIAAAVSGVTYSTTPNAANQLNCSVGTTTITCFESDLQTQATTTTPAPVAAQTYTVTYTVTFDEKTVPLTTINGQATASQTSGSLYAAAAGYTTTATTATPSVTSLTVQRSTNLMQSLALVRTGAAPVGFADAADLNLDEHITGNTAGANDTITYTAKLYNNGADDAAGVTVTLPIPAYLELFSLPAGCAITGAPGTTPTFAAPYTTGAAGGSLTCTPPSTTTAAGTATGQIAASVGTAACAGTTTTAGCFVISFPAKFVDAPSAATIVGNLAKVTYQPTAATATGNDVDPGTGLTSSTPPSIGVQRAAHLVAALTLKPNVNAPATFADTTDINLDEHTAGNAAGVNDQVQFGLTTYNSGPNYALNVVVTVPLPAYLELFSLPTNCVITGATTTVPTTATPYTTGASGGSLTCTPPAIGATPAGDLLYGVTSCPAVQTGTTPCLYGTSSTVLKFVDAPSAATVVGNNAMVTVTDAAPAPAGLFSDSGGTASAVAPTSFGVQRAAHVVETYTLAPQVNAPATFADTADINLDEHTAGNAGGVNDQVKFALNAYNQGPNYALNVSVTVALPAYLELFSLPSNCVITGATTTTPTLSTPYTTGAAGGSLTCTPPAIAATPAGDLMYGGSCPAVQTATTPCLYGTSATALKFVDATTAATIVGSTAKVTVTNTVTAPTGLFNDSNKSLTATVTPTTFGVQRAAHVRLATASPLTATYSDNSPLSLDGVTPEIGQAANGMNPATRTATGTLIYNCLRYAVNVVNDGPNYANAPVLNYAISGGPFTYEQKSLSSASTTLTPVNCSATGSGGSTTAGGAAQTFSIGSVGYGGGTQSVVLDGYYGLTTLGTASSGLSTLSTAAFTPTGYNDSNTTGTNTTKDYLGTKVVEVVNTPINTAATGGVGIAPTGAPALTLIFTSVTAPGATSATVSGTTALTLPQGKSPNPTDAGAAAKALYQAGLSPQYYSVPTTATISAASANATSVCVTQAAGLPDVFVKPERALLWMLQGTTTGTTLNPVPNITSTGALAGDITALVTSSGAAYVKVPATITFPQVPQAQPSQVCGVVNGFTTSTTAPATFAVLEPVNFAPYVVAGSASVATQQGKGSSSAQTDIYIQVSGTQTHDYNDNDPCYIGGVRSSCDDNPYLYVFVYNAGISAPVLVSSLQPETSTTAGANAKFLSQGNLSASTTVYVAVADQATGADSYDSAITNNPYLHEGNFLTAPSSSGIKVCDPGQGSGTYSLNSVACTGITGATTQRLVPGGSGYIYTTVGAAAVTVTGGSSAGLIGLPFPSTSPLTTIPTSNTPPANPVSPSGAPLPAIAYVTPGQTAGFAWNWLNGVVQQSSSVRYTLACKFVTSLTDATPVAAPYGTSCNIATADPNAPAPNQFAYSINNYAPSIYVTTAGNQFAEHAPGTWQRIGNGMVFALLLPMLLFRKRAGEGAVSLALVLSLVTLPLLIGCGSATSTSAAANVTPSGTIYLQVTATNAAATPQAVASAVFEVVVQSPN